MISDGTATPGDGRDSPADWPARAQALSAALARRFWRPFPWPVGLRAGLFAATTSPYAEAGTGRRSRNWNYWWQAHALEVVVDRAERLGRAHALPAARTAAADAGASHLRGITWRILGRWAANDFHDDRAWMALALRRAREVLGLRTVRAEATCYQQIVAGIDPVTGAVPWRRGDAFINAPANGPTALLACRRGDLALAGSLLGWVERTLRDPDTQLIIDGVHRTANTAAHATANTAAPERTIYTYNQGTVIGAHLAMSRAIPDPALAAEHLRLARLTADAALRELTEDGVFTECRTGDGGLFKGILVRHLAALAEATGEPRYLDALFTNGEAMWGCRDGDGVVGPSWIRPVPGAVRELSAHLSALILAEQLARLSARPDRPSGH